MRNCQDSMIKLAYTRKTDKILLGTYLISEHTTYAFRLTFRSMQFQLQFETSLLPIDFRKTALIVFIHLLHIQMIGKRWQGTTECTTSICCVCHLFGHHSWTIRHRTKSHCYFSNGSQLSGTTAASILIRMCALIARRRCGRMQWAQCHIFWCHRCTCSATTSTTFTISIAVAIFWWWRWRFQWVKTKV